MVTLTACHYRAVYRQLGKGVYFLFLSKKSISETLLTNKVLLSHLIVLIIVQLKTHVKTGKTQTGSTPGV